MDTAHPSELPVFYFMCVSHQINLAASPAAAQLINRAQSVNSATASGLAQQAVLLGNTSSPALTASQAQMYLRAQMVSTHSLDLPLRLGGQGQKLGARRLKKEGGAGEAGGKQKGIE